MKKQQLTYDSIEVQVSNPLQHGEACHSLSASTAIIATSRAVYIMCCLVTPPFTSSSLQCENSKELQVHTINFATLQRLHKVCLEEVEVEFSEVCLWKVIQDFRVISVVGGHSVSKEKCVSHNTAVAAAVLIFYVTK